MRFQSDVPLQPASILLYKSDNKGLKAVLAEAGHKLQSVENREDLEAALKVGKYDILMVTLPDASGVESLAVSSPSKPILLPHVVKGAKAEIAHAEKQYGYVLKAPNRTGHYLSTVDKAMNLKSKRDAGNQQIANSA